MNTDGWWVEAFEKGAFPLAELAGLPDWRARTQRQVASAMKALRLKKNRTLLDVGCGIGRHAVPLAKKGVAVTGIDISRAYLKEAKRRAGRAPLTLKRCDMRRLPYRSEFDAALCLYTTLGYFEDASDDLKVLRGVYRALKPGGLFLLEVANGPHIMNLIAAQERMGVDAARWHEEPGGRFILERPRLDLKRNGVVTNWVFLKGAKRRQFTSFVRMYSRRTLRTQLTKCGFLIRQVAGDLPFTNYRSDSPRLVILAQK